MEGKHPVKFTDIPKDSDYEKVVLDYYRAQAAKSIQYAYRALKGGSYLLRTGLGRYDTIDELEKEISNSTLAWKKNKHHKVIIVLIDDDKLYTLKITKTGKANIKPIVAHEGNSLQYDLLKQELLKQNHSFISDIKELTPVTKSQKKLIIPLLTNIQKLTEPTDKTASKAMAEHIKNNRYEDIDYSLPDFTQHLFTALRAGEITMNQMTTAKLMYESLLCFNNNQIPENPSQYFNRHILGEENSPYQPDKKIAYWGESENIKLASEPERNKLYYTIKLPNHMQAGIIYNKLKNPAMDTKTLQNALKDFFPIGGDLIAGLSSNNTYEAAKLQALIKISNPCLENFLNQTYVIDNTHTSKEFKQSLEEFRKQINDVQFIAELSKFDSNLPVLCQEKNELHFVLPTIDTFNTMTKIAFGEETALPQPFIGAGQTRQIRAYDELPKLDKNIRTEAQKILDTLYPLAGKLTQASRIVELTYPGIPQTQDPHQAHCHDFMLSWHDLFHVWRASENYKNFIRALRTLHDEKGGFAKKNSGMSKSLWVLSDVDFSIGKAIREEASQTGNIPIAYLLWIMDDAFKEQDDMYLLLYDEYKNQDSWKKMLFTEPLDEVLSAEATQSIAVARWLKQHKPDVTATLTRHPEASVVECILHDLLDLNGDETPEKINTRNIIHNLAEQDGLKKIFTWTENDGIHFKQAVYDNYQFKQAGIKSKLRENQTLDIRKALQLIFLTQILMKTNTSTELNDIFSQCNLKCSDYALVMKAFNEEQKNSFIGWIKDQKNLRDINASADDIIGILPLLNRDQRMVLLQEWMNTPIKKMFFNDTLFHVKPEKWCDLFSCLRHDEDHQKLVLGKMLNTICSSVSIEQAQKISTYLSEENQLIPNNQAVSEREPNLSPIWSFILEILTQLYQCLMYILQYSKQTKAEENIIGSGPSFT